MGKGLTVVRSLQRKHMLDSWVREHVQTSLQGIAEKASWLCLDLVRKRVLSKSSVREFRTPRSVRGQPGNWLSYRDRSFNRNIRYPAVMESHFAVDNNAVLKEIYFDRVLVAV